LNLETNLQKLSFKQWPPPSLFLYNYTTWLIGETFCLRVNEMSELHGLHEQPDTSDCSTQLTGQMINNCRFIVGSE